MSKFHVGDKVRIAPGAWVTKVSGIHVGDVGEVMDVDEHATYPYFVEVDGQRSDYFKDSELRPADIFAQDTEVSAIADAVDVVNHPPHYNRFPVEVINITEQLDFNRGNAVKYLARAGFKEGVDEMEDLSKAAWYVNRAIEKLRKERESNDV